MTPPKLVAMLGLMFYSGSVCLAITLIVDSSLEGTEHELMYFLFPSVFVSCSLFLILMVCIVAFDLYYPASDPWVENLGCELQVESQWQWRCIRCIPPLWQQVVR